MSGWDEVKQRKLQPIYNAIESRNYKGALKLCAKKDLEKWDIVKALKAYSLERVGRDDEALSLCREVAARQPTDDTLLSTLTMTLKSLGAAEEATVVYENALTKQPDNEETGKELVTCYCRTRHFNKAQVLATRLYKHHPQQHNYALWAGVSMILQVRAGTLPPKMLELSERLVHRALSSRVEQGLSLSYEEVMLYLDLLTDTKKHQEALRVLREWVGVEGGKGEEKRREAGRAIVDQDTSSHRNHVAMNDNERRSVECGLLMELGHYREAANAYTHAIKHNPDCWSSWKGLLSCLWSLSSDGHKEGWASEAETLCLSLQASHPHMRGPFLAHMEAIRMCASPLSVSQQSCLSSLLVSYVRVFGAKLCCFEDVTPYLSSLRTQASQDVKASLIQQLTQLSCESSTVGCEGDEEVLAKAQGDKPTAMKRLHTYIRTQQVLRFLCDGAVGGGGVGEWSGEYQRTLFLNNDAQGGQREVQQGDELVLLSAHALLEEAAALDKTAQHTTALARRLEACCLLEQCVRYSPYSYSMRLLLLRCYASLGAWEPALHHWNKLEVKQIQCETLSYLLLPPCLHWGFFNEARAGCVGVLSVHKSSARECGEQMGKALQCGTYTKALEMDRFQVEKMDKSLQLHLAKVCLMELELCLKRHTNEAAKAYVTELVGGGLREAFEPFTPPLTDNQDHSITKSWRDESGRAKHRDIKRERLHHRVSGGVLLPRLLLTLLQPDPTPPTQLQSLLDAYKEHALPLLTPSAHDDTTSLEDALQHLSLTQGVGERKWGRELSLCCLQAATHTLPTLTPTPTPEQVSVAVSSLSSLLSLLDECRVGLSRPSPAPSPYVLPPLSPSAPASLLLPQWIKTTAECVLGSCGYVGLLVERLMNAVHTHTSTATGSKKKKKGAATDPPAPPPTTPPTQQVCVLVRGVCESWVSLLSTLEASLHSIKDAHASGGSEAGASSLASTVWGPTTEAFLTFIGEEDFGDLRVEVVRGVRSSQATSCLRLVDIISPKLKAAQALL